MLAQITHPTSGSIKLNGRVASLLEVGTGFHPELTGRENVYLNGTILGMTKNEIDLNIDKIVEFSGVKKFLDTPVKKKVFERYACSFSFFCCCSPQT